ncbi:MAG: enoyl-CoA hydratase/isomerase family protein, partial [Bacteroidetes bacterium]
MKTKETITLHMNGAVATVTLSRPGVRNAMNLDMIRELTRAITDLDEHPSVR